MEWRETIFCQYDCPLHCSVIGSSTSPITVDSKVKVKVFPLPVLVVKLVVSDVVVMEVVRLVSMRTVENGFNSIALLFGSLVGIFLVLTLDEYHVNQSSLIPMILIGCKVIRTLDSSDPGQDDVQQDQDGPYDGC